MDTYRAWVWVIAILNLCVSSAEGRSTRKRWRREPFDSHILQGTLNAQAFRNGADISVTRTIGGEIATIPSVINKLRTISKRAGNNFKADVIGMGTMMNNEDESAGSTVEMKVELAISNIKSESDESTKTEFTWLYVGILPFDKNGLEGSGSFQIRGEFVFHLVDQVQRERRAGFAGSGFFMD